MIHTFNEATYVFEVANNQAAEAVGLVLVKKGRECKQTRKSH